MSNLYAAVSSTSIKLISNYLPVHPLDSRQQHFQAGLERRLEMRRLEERRSRGEVFEIGGDRLVGHRFGGGRSLGVAGGLIQCGTGEVVADLAEIRGGVAVGEAGLTQNADDAVDEGDA